jgi:hypothetical protein
MYRYHSLNAAKASHTFHHLHHTLFMKADPQASTAEPLRQGKSLGHRKFFAGKINSAARRRGPSLQAGALAA